MQFSLTQVTHILGGSLEGDGEVKINALSNIEEGKPGTISFLSNPKYEPHIYTTNASAVIVKKDFTPKQTITPALIRVDNPYLSFTALLEEYHKLFSFSKKGVESPSYQSENATIGKDVYLGAFSYIGNNAKIGNNVKIYPQVYIGDDVEIGDNTIVYAGVKINHQVKIGKHCVFQSGAVIGSDGFGFAPQPDGTYKTIPQVGNVIIHDRVDIGANTVVDRATFESTIIKSGVKLDNLVQIAHNVEIDENTVIAAQAGVSGSSKIGKNVVIAGQAGIVGHLKVADKTIVAAQSGIPKNTKEGAAYLGSPALEISDARRSIVAYKRLPELMKRVQELEQKILNLTSTTE